MDKDRFKNSGFSFAPIETKRASEIVYEQIREAILNGDLKSGDKLPSERQLVDIYERSHATIREALRMLESNGYISVAPGGGSTIRELSPKAAVQPLQDIVTFRKISVEEIVEFLSSIESSFVKQAIESATPEQIDEMHKAYDAMVSSKDDTIAFFDAILTFHTAVLKATNSVLLRIIWESFRSSIFTINEYQITTSPLVSSRENRLELITIYRSLLAAFYEKKSEAADELVTKCWNQAN